MASVRPVPTMAELCLESAATHGDAIALADGTRSVTYRQLADRARVVASHLLRMPIRPGAHVVVSGPNSVVWVVAAFGVLLVGAVVVPVNHRCPAGQRLRTVETVRPALVLGDCDVWAGFGVPVLALDDLDDLDDATTGRTAATLPEVTADMTAVVLQTSGTTGDAKFVPMRHGPLLRLYGALAPRIGLTATDRLLGVVPLAHGFGLLGVLLSAFLAGAAVRMVAEYDRRRIADLIAAERLTAIFAPPTVFHDLEPEAAAHRPQCRPYRRPNCRIALTGGADVSLERFHAICDAMAVPRRFVGYGLTEAYGLVAFADVGSVRSGPPPLTPLPGVQARVADGEVLVRGASVLTAYLEGQPAVDGDGWLHTGDLGRMNSRGQLQILSRLSETVIVSGFNVSPEEVEAVLRAHPSVADVVAFGVPDARRGERLVACVVTNQGETFDGTLLREYCRDRLTDYQVPSELFPVAALPTTAIGKPARAALRAAVVDGSGTPAPTERNGGSRAGRQP